MNIKELKEKYPFLRHWSDFYAQIIFNSIEDIEAYMERSNKLKEKNKDLWKNHPKTQS